MKKIVTVCVFIYCAFHSFSQEYINRFESIDVNEYSIAIDLNDSNNIITVIEKINITFFQAVDSFYLDLVDQNKDKKGMKITQILENGKEIQFTHSNSKLTIVSDNALVGVTRVYTISYSGIPKDGLVISKNKYGDRTFFGDNWPTRARNWIACVDHPSDKAIVSWQVDAPDQYKVVANGELKYEVTLPYNRKRWNYFCSTAIPTKVMVIGVAKFEVEQSGTVQNIPVTSWVYPQNKVTGFYDYALATGILDYFISHFGPYSYEKLANVQSTTRFGGMENASCIFYDENSITGKRDCETLLAHEIAHQWFGNTASEMDWPHLWLSEGFATYCTNLYIEEKIGKEAFVKQLEDDREKVIRFYKMNQNPVVDTISLDLMSMLNTNAYQKGAWVLHMLRRKMGDELFWKGIRAYYKKSRFSNATSDDFIQMMEQDSQMDLKSFFHQWLRESGHPKIQIETKGGKKNIELTVNQRQDTKVLFDFPLEVKLIYTDDSFEYRTIEIKKLKETFNFPITKKFKKLILDPNVNLLFEEIK